jgi:hypothetical protein
VFFPWQVSLDNFYCSCSRSVVKPRFIWLKGHFLFIKIVKLKVFLVHLFSLTAVHTNNKFSFYDSFTEAGMTSWFGTRLLGKEKFGLEKLVKENLFVCIGNYGALYP